MTDRTGPIEFFKISSQYFKSKIFTNSVSWLLLKSQDLKDCVHITHMATGVPWWLPTSKQACVFWVFLLQPLAECRQAVIASVLALGSY
jgi:hypothetical protein